MIEELDNLTSIGEEMTRRARASGTLLIWRAQVAGSRHVVVRDGKPEVSAVSSASGHGVQVVTPEGQVALASRDDFVPERALALLERVTRTAAQAARLGLDGAELPELQPEHARSVPAGSLSVDDVDLAEAGRRLAELEAELAGRVPGVSLRLSFKAGLNAWRIFRSDGTDVLFAMPRCLLNVRATSAGGETRHGVSTSLFRPGPDEIWSDSAQRLFIKRAEQAARLARELPAAPTHPAGSYPLVIDYALAKGLAHEAFGHACEADSYRSSVLAEEGRLRRGHSVGADHVSIIDEPVERDHAWQPFSANGVRRERAVLVDHGKLCDGLSDPWSAGPGGVRLTGAARAESYRNAPLPRMSNIRLEVDDPLPAPGEIEDYGPERVRDLLRESGVLKRHPKVIYLSGYTGGQVNTALGEFVFNCRAIYELSDSGATLYKPAIFSGSMFGALRSVREAYGPLLLDAIGYCGKWGQSVPSSGGSHFFLMLDADPSVRLGGS